MALPLDWVAVASCRYELPLLLVATSQHVLEMLGDQSINENLRGPVYRLKYMIAKSSARFGRASSTQLFQTARW
jgi:hypothetical protein